MCFFPSPLFHSNAALSFSSKVCYIKYRDPSSVGVAQHLTNTVFIDRALIVVPCAEGEYLHFGFSISARLFFFFICHIFPFNPTACKCIFG